MKYIGFNNTALNKLDNANSPSLSMIGLVSIHPSSSSAFFALLVSSMRHAHFVSTINDRANYDEKLFEAIAHFSSAALRYAYMHAAPSIPMTLPLTHSPS